MEGNGREYDHDLDVEYEDDWRQERIITPGRMEYQHNYPMPQRPSMSTTRMGLIAGTHRKVPLIIRKPTASHPRVHYNHLSSHHHLAVPRQSGHRIRMNKMNGESSSHEVQYQVPYDNEETVITSEEQNEDEEEEETGLHDHSIKRLEDELEVDVGVTEGPSSSMPKMIVRTKGMPVFHPAENKALIENHQLKSKIASLLDSNFRYREEITQLRDQNRDLLRQIRRQEKIIEKQSVELGELETINNDMKRRERETERKFEREMLMRDKRRKAITVMPCLPNRKVIFSKATKQAQSLRLRLLHRYLGELCGPVEGEHRLEEKNLIVLRWRKAHAPKPSLEIGRQLLPPEEEEFCKRFGIMGEMKKEMKKWLGQKHIDLFGPSERAIAVRKWRMGQREKKRKGEKEDQMMVVEEDILEEVGNDTEDDELMDDIETVLDEEAIQGEKTAEEVDGDSILSGDNT